MALKYHSVRTWSNLCKRWFASKAEAARGAELHFLEMAGEITDLHYQVRFMLSLKPRITITVDFAYMEKEQQVYEDSKGVLTRDFRTKLAWLKEKYGVGVKLGTAHQTWDKIVETLQEDGPVVIDDDEID